VKRILIISYYWPPSGGISVHRSLKFVKYLAKSGWLPVVYVPKNAHYPYLDESTCKDVPQEAIIIKKNILEPFALFKLLSGRNKEDALNNIVYVRDKKHSFIDNLGIWIRGNFFIPDARSLWIKPSVNFLIKYLKNDPVEVILADGPPHTNTVIAMKVAKKMNIPYLADFQDPWTQVDYYPFMKITKWADNIHKKLERKVLDQASKITIASPSWKHDLELIGAKNVDVIYWGYDEDDFVGLKQKIDDHFTITHTGLMGFDRNTKNLFRALKELIVKYPELKDDLKFHFAGQVDYSVIEEISKNGLGQNLVNFGSLKRPEALQLCLNSQILLLPLNVSANSKGRMPGKFYEYLRTRRPILVFGPHDSDVAQIVRKLGCGESFEYQDLEGIKGYIEHLYLDYKNNGLENCIADISEFSVANQVKKLSDFLNDIIKGE
jgi:glycosyltransferase involved in cell wall biosynthesis